MTTAEADISLITANLDLCPLGNGLARLINAQGHGGFFTAPTKGSNLSDIISDGE